MPRKFLRGEQLRSPRLALLVLGFIALYAGISAWLPWGAGSTVAPPVWAVRLGLDHPFRSVYFILASLLLFANTLACTLDRTGRVLGLWRGRIPPGGAEFICPQHGDIADFLSSSGFSGREGLYYRYRPALWGGPVLHGGILMLLAAVAVQQAWSDGGAFELSEGETVSLSRQGSVFGREKGVFAAAAPPDIEVALVSFDPFLHQAKYAPDRSSLLRLITADGRVREGRLDRARGIEAGDVTVFQAIPSGFALNLEIPGLGVRSIHLRGAGRSATAEVRDPAGEPTRFRLDAERDLQDPLGTGTITITLERRGERTRLVPGEPFPFGSVNARLVDVRRWAGFTYSRTAGISLVFAGFAVVLLGSLLLLFPSGVACVEERGGARVLRLHLPRGRDVFLRDWQEVWETSGKVEGGD